MDVVEDFGEPVGNDSQSTIRDAIWTRGTLLNLVQGNQEMPGIDGPVELLDRRGAKETI